MKLSELMSKDIINDDDGIKLGKIIDIDLDSTNGDILNIIINKGIKLSNFFSTKEQIIIPWNKIIKIGNDVIIAQKDFRRFGISTHRQIIFVVAGIHGISQTALFEFTDTVGTAGAFAGRGKCRQQHGR